MTFENYWDEISSQIALYNADNDSTYSFEVIKVEIFSNDPPIPGNES